MAASALGMAANSVLFAALRIIEKTKQTGAGAQGHKSGADEPATKQNKKKKKKKKKKERKGKENETPS